MGRRKRGALVDGWVCLDKPLNLGSTDAVTRATTLLPPMLGADGQAVASTLFSVPRDVTLLGRRMLLLAVAGSTVLLLLVLIVLRRLIARLVLRPLHRVESGVQAAAPTDVSGGVKTLGKAQQPRSRLQRNVC